MFLSRLTLSRRPSVAALGALLSPEDEDRRLDAHHRLIWTAFAGDAAARRDFLWREEGEGRFMVLSARPPGPAELFEPADVKPFAPDLAPGDRLAFLLRANAARSVKTERIAPSGKRVRAHRDVVMEALHAVPRPERAAARLALAETAARGWLAGQGARGGFAVEEARAAGYRVLQPPARGARRPRFGVLDLEGVIRVEAPAPFLARLALGFGRAKAFGCGLMLIRRA